jgi:tRNA pseudouridine32 synthase/23S rRNA pseudouridine746 synthase
MMKGMDVEQSEHRADTGNTLVILYEDEHVVVVNKPSGLLSVPGKEESDSVYTRIRAKYPQATGSVTVHRLDMSTSGLMLIALHAEAHKILQQQFLTRSVEKRYTALLDGYVEKHEGTINLPLRVDLDDRPRQMVCYEHGKAARTHWRVSGYEAGKTRIHFFPVTGRTHQLRVHAAHPEGLNTPIVGDELYGSGGTRLHLHADRLQFTHPASGVRMKFEAQDAF